MRHLVRFVSVLVILFDLYFLCLSLKGAINLVKICDETSIAKLESISSKQDYLRGNYTTNNLMFVGKPYDKVDDIKDNLEVHYQSSNTNNYYLGTTADYIIKRVDMQFLFLIVFLIILIFDRRTGVA